MSGLSDLELVAQAMAPTNLPDDAKKADDAAFPAAAQPTGSTTTSINPSKPLDSSQRPSAFDPLDSDARDDSDVKAIEAGKTNGTGKEGPEEWESLAELKRINDVLKLADAASSGADGAGGEEDMDESQIMQLLQQMDAAGLVADDIEGKLDALLKSLGSVEEEMSAGLAQGAGEKK